MFLVLAFVSRNFPAFHPKEPSRFCLIKWASVWNEKTNFFVQSGPARPSGVDGRCIATSISNIVRPHKMKWSNLLETETFVVNILQWAIVPFLLKPARLSVRRLPACLLQLPACLLFCLPACLPPSILLLFKHPQSCFPDWQTQNFAACSPFWRPAGRPSVRPSVRLFSDRARRLYTSLQLLLLQQTVEATKHACGVVWWCRREKNR
jgi:hypothetical protein